MNTTIQPNPSAIHHRRLGIPRLGRAAIVAAVAVAGMASSVFADLPMRDLAAKARNGVGTVLVQDAGRELVGTGSGFFIAPQLFVTNYHVVSGGSSVDIRLADGRTFKVAGLVAEDARNDVVILKIEIPVDAGHSPLPLANEVPQQGDTIIVMGAPRGLEFTLSTGLVAAVRSMPQQGVAPIIQITAPISPGNSGGPVLNMEGEVLGVASFTRIDGQNLNFAQPVEHVRELAAKSSTAPKSISAWTQATAEQDYRTALDLLKHNDFEGAAKLLIKVCRAQPTHAQAWYHLGIALHGAELYAESAMAFLRHLETGVKGKAAAETWNRIGINLLKLKDLDRATASFLKAVEIDPACREAWINLADCYARSGDVTGRCSALDKAWQLNKKDSKVARALSDAFTDAAVLRLNDGDAKLAIRLLDSALQLDPENARALFIVGVLAARAGMQAEAKAIYDKLQGLDPDLAKQLRAVMRT